MSRGPTPPLTPKPPLGICQVLCFHGGASRFKITSFHGQIVPSYRQIIQQVQCKTLHEACFFGFLA